MSQNSEEAKTHTGDAFLEFAYDLLEYTVPKYKYEWSKPENYQRSLKKVFKESFGDAIMLFRKRHEKEFEERLSRFFSIEEYDTDVESFSEKFCERTFKGKVPLMELIAYFAFLLDAGLFYFSINEKEQAHDLAEETYGVFYKYVERYFTIVGGWHALYQVAEQYVNFVNFIPSGIVSASAPELPPVSKL